MADLHETCSFELSKISYLNRAQDILEMKLPFQLHAKLDRAKGKEDHGFENYELYH